MLAIVNAIPDSLPKLIPMESVIGPFLQIVQFSRCLLLWVAVSVFSAAQAQELVANGTFDSGLPTSWVQGPNSGFVGYVREPRWGGGGTDSWIAFEGSFTQELKTTPGQTYRLRFDAHGFDPQDTLRPSRLSVFWDDQMAARLDFEITDSNWIRVRGLIQATGETTRLRLTGVSRPSVDNVSVVPMEPPYVAGTVESPAVGAVFHEGGSVAIKTLWNSVGGAIHSGNVRFFLNGVRELGTGQGATASFWWTNLPVGIHALSAESDGLRTASVQIEVKAVPKFRIDSPRSNSVFRPGQTIPLAAQLLDNGGTDPVRAVRFLVNGQPFLSFPPGVTAGLSTNWVPNEAGTYEFTAVGEREDGSEIARASLTVHVLEPVVLDTDLGDWGSGFSFLRASPVAQTFLAGVSGWLQAVEFPAGHNDGFQTGPLTVAIHDVEEGQPGPTRLAEATVALADAWVDPKNSIQARFTFASDPVRVVAGRSYAVVISTPFTSPPESYVRVVSPDQYPGGQFWQRSGLIWKPVFLFNDRVYPADLALRTYVAPVSPPEIRLTSPRPFTRTAVSEVIVLRAEVADPAQSVKAVSFLVDGQFLGRVSAPPFEWDWSASAPGNHVIQAIAEDEEGPLGAAATVSVLSELSLWDLPKLIVEDAASPEGLNSIPPLVFRLRLSAPSEFPVSVNYATRDETALELVDYLPARGTVTFAPGEQEKWVWVRMLGDARDEPNERLWLELSDVQGAILTRTAARGTLVDDEFGSGKAVSYDWQLETNVVRAGELLTVTLSARDSSGALVSDVPGSLRLSVEAPPGPRYRLIDEVTVTTSQTFSPFTFGYAFRPSTELLLTHFRRWAGQKVSLWSDDGVLIATVDFPTASAPWQSQELPSPIRLQAGRRYRLGVFIDANSAPSSAGNPCVFSHGLVEWSYAVGGDRFPTETSPLWGLVDFEYQVIAPGQPGTEPGEISGFDGGRWTGQVRIKATGDLRLGLTDILGRFSLSPVLSVLLPEEPRIRVMTASDRSFLEVYAPAGRRYTVQASLDLQSWSTVTEMLPPTTPPFRWELGPPEAPFQFFRVQQVE